MKLYPFILSLIFIFLQGCKKVEEQSIFNIPPNIISLDLINSEKYDIKKIKEEIINRIKNGDYNDYTVDLCIDSLGRCNTNEFIKYKKDDNYSLVISSKDWENYNELVQAEILNEIIYYTWGHKKNEYNPLDVNFPNNQSPFEFLNNKSKELYTTYSKPEYLKGGKGKYAYGPNCWYTSISSIVDKNCKYSKSFNLEASIWNKPRFMGAAEFRCLMSKFEKVSKPQFGDIVRYYTDSIYYDESIDLYNGEVHAAIYIGKDSINNREIVLTKNGRNDLGFLLFQDIKGLDKLYLNKTKKDPRIKNYFRLKPGTKFFDAAIYKKLSDCYEAYKIDSINYQKRWDCLAGKIKPDICNSKPSCYCFPLKWKY